MKTIVAIFAICFLGAIAYDQSQEIKWLRRTSNDLAQQYFDLKDRCR